MVHSGSIYKDGEDSSGCMSGGIYFDGHQFFSLDASLL